MIESARAYSADSFDARAIERASRLRGLLILLLTAGTLAALYLLPLLHRAPNRLLVGTPFYAHDALPIGVLLGVGSALSLGSRRAAALIAAACYAGALLLLALDIGTAAEGLLAAQPSPTRVRLASGAIASGGLIVVALAIVSARIDRRWGRPLILTGAAAAFMALAAFGWFDHLSLMVEFQARRDAVAAAALEHLGLVAAALILAACTTALAYLWRPARGVAELAINGLQVLPAVALLGGLVAGLAAVTHAVPALRELGLSALGPVPAVLGIAAYLLLPLWRGLHAGLNAPDPATIDAGEAIGLTPRQMLVRVRLPLGAPMLVGGLRVATVQAIGLATLAALVGAGGLGGIVFDGMAQFAPDLILLGAMPIVLLSLAADGLLGQVEAWSKRRWR